MAGKLFKTSHLCLAFSCTVDLRVFGWSVLGCFSLFFLLFNCMGLVFGFFGFFVRLITAFYESFINCILIPYQLHVCSSVPDFWLLV